MVYHYEMATSYKLRKKIQKLLRLRAENHLYTQKKQVDQDEIKCGNFYQKELTKVIQHWTRLQRNWSLMHPRNSIWRKHSAPSQFFCQSNGIWKGNGRLNSRKFQTYQCTKVIQKQK